MKLTTGNVIGLLMCGAACQRLVNAALILLGLFSPASADLQILAALALIGMGLVLIVRSVPSPAQR